MINVVAI